MPEEPPRRPPRRGASILSDTDGDGSDGSDDDDDDRRFAGGGADADSPSVPAPRSSDSDDEDDRDEEALDAQIEALRRQIAAGRLTPSQASETDQVAEDPVDELLGSERWDAGALAAADNDTLDALIDRLAKSRPQTDPMSMLEREEAAARRMKVQTDLMAYLHELRRRAKVDFPPDFAELVEELVANATKRDAQLRAVGLRGKVAAINDDDDDDAASRGGGGGGRMPDPWTNPETGLDMISAEDLDPKIRAGLEKIRRYDEMLLAKEAEQRMVEQETLERAGGGGGGGADSGDVRGGAGDDDGNDGDDGDELGGGLEARVARRRARRLRKIARLRRTLRGDDAERMGGAAARNAANTGANTRTGARRLAKLTEEEDALAERLLEEFAREEGGRSGVRGIDSSAAASLDADVEADVDADVGADVDADARSVAASTRSFASSVNTNPFAVTRAIAGVVHPGAGTAFGSLDVDAHGPVDEDARRLAEIERALGEIASGRGTAAKTQPASSSSPASAVSSSPAPSSASALARRLGASSVSAGGGWDDDGEKENDSVRTFRGEFDGENYLEDAREDRELREVDETVDAALRRMKTKGAFPERLTAEEMRRLVDECRSEQGA
jgi:hypothetical protein